MKNTQDGTPDQIGSHQEERNSYRCLRKPECQNKTVNGDNERKDLGKNAEKVSVNGAFSNDLAIQHVMNFPGEQQTADDKKRSYFKCRDPIALDRDLPPAGCLCLWSH